MNVPNNLLYTKDHEWVKIDGNAATMGITDYAQSALGDITYIELPKLATAAKQSQRLATVESVKAASDIYAPLSGNIAKINNSLDSQPEILNQSPYEKGWIAVIDIKDINEKKNLMTSQQYSEHVKGLS